VKVREVGFRSTLKDLSGTSGAAIVRRTKFFSASVLDERWAHRTVLRETVSDWSLDIHR
jgi:hypothetical protein